MPNSIIAHLFTFLMAITIVFQLALLIGMPWGELSLGGKYPGVLPKNKRWIPLFSTITLIAFAIIIEIRAGYILPEWENFADVMVWFVVAYCALGVIVNTITPSKWERIIWLPVVFAAFICSLLVTLS